MGAKPCGICRRHENVENQKAGFPQFHSALENSPSKERAVEFPTAPTGPDPGPLSLEAEKQKEKHYDLILCLTPTDLLMEGL